jgi:hypothetical protein
MGLITVRMLLHKASLEASARFYESNHRTLNSVPQMTLQNQSKYQSLLQFESMTTINTSHKSYNLEGIVDTKKYQWGRRDIQLKQSEKQNSTSSASGLLVGTV